MRSPESEASARTSSPKHWLAVGAAGAAIAVAVLGAAATAWAGEEAPSPASSDDASYQIPAPGESAPTAKLVDRGSADPNSVQPPDLSPDQVKRMKENALAEEAARQAALPK